MRALTHMQWTGCESNPQPLGYESDTLPLDHCTHLQAEFSRKQTALVSLWDLLAFQVGSLQWDHKSTSHLEICGLACSSMLQSTQRIELISNIFLSKYVSSNGRRHLQWTDTHGGRCTRLTWKLRSNQTTPCFLSLYQFLEHINKHVNN